MTETEYMLVAEDDKPEHFTWHGPFSSQESAENYARQRVAEPWFLVPMTDQIREDLATLNKHLKELRIEAQGGQK